MGRDPRWARSESKLMNVPVHPETSTHTEERLHRGLQNRHIQLIAIGGATGTGLSMVSGKTIAAAGPSVLIVYLVIGTMLFFVMRAMGVNPDDPTKIRAASPLLGLVVLLGCWA